MKGEPTESENMLNNARIDISTDANRELVECSITGVCVDKSGETHRSRRL